MSDSKRCKLYESLSCESSAHSFLNELHCSDIGRSAAQELCRIVCREAKTEWEAANTRRSALTLFAKTDTHTNTYTLMPHCLLKLSTGHRVDQKEERSAGCLNMNMNQGGGEEEANNIPDIGQ